MHYPTLCVMALIALMSTATQQAPASRDPAAVVADMLMKQEAELEAAAAQVLASQAKAKYCRPDPSDPENYWMWEPPVPCRFENSTSGDAFYSYPCDEGFQCAIGPLPVTVDGTAGDAYFCGYYTTPILLYHACRVFDDSIVLKNQFCRNNEGTCALGPLYVESGNTTVDVFYCSNLPNSWLNATYTVLDRACRAVDKGYDIKFQRHCPDGFACTSDPYPVTLSDGTLGFAFTCEYDNSTVTDNTDTTTPLPTDMTLSEILAKLIYVLVERHASGSPVSDLETKLFGKLLDYMKENGGKLEGSNDDEDFLIFVLTRILAAAQRIEAKLGQNMQTITDLFAEIGREKGKNAVLLEILHGIVQHAHAVDSSAAGVLQTMVTQVLQNLLMGGASGHASGGNGGWEAGQGSGHGNGGGHVHVAQRADCAVDNGGCEHICIQSYYTCTCRCRTGYYALSADQSTCQDDNECLTSPCESGYVCVNKPGSFACVNTLQNTPSAGSQTVSPVGGKNSPAPSGGQSVPTAGPAAGQSTAPAVTAPVVSSGKGQPSSSTFSASTLVGVGIGLAVFGALATLAVVVGVRMAGRKGSRVPHGARSLRSFNSDSISSGNSYISSNISARALEAVMFQPGTLRSDTSAETISNPVVNVHGSLSSTPSGYNDH